MTDHGLFGWPRGEITSLVPGDVGVIGVPSDFGNAYVSGTRAGPEAIRRSSASMPLQDVAGHDLGDVDVFDGADWPEIVERTGERVRRIAGQGAMPLVLGGDHAVSYAAVSALDRVGTFDIVWFDAHTDFCPWHGADWHNHKQVLRRIASLPHVGRLLVVGHRGITYFDESLQWPALEVVRSASPGHAPSIPSPWLEGERPIYVSIDIDVLDPCIAPGTGHPVPGGLSLDTLCNMVRTVARRRHIVGADVMEVNPLLDHEAMTSRAAAEVLSVLVRARLPHSLPATDGALA
ncbi:hypothetical protein HBF26_15155 [Luteibacter jiangsuensis]|uniref:Agmatinase n=1 Tax=Luteibacter jiangsuensis TaxID=637577 RepID=A0ABX0Q8Q9_9GAMM|nr:arginase family protein [Luteibacter jiangsuensis]NID06231.1 hypothetical protein [Luteibacter jiangsuensis]